MAQVFRPVANTLSRASLACLIIIPGLAVMIGSTITRSGYNTGVNVALDQPVPFSHQHHVQELGIDCRYCHTSVEKSGFAGIPSTQTCMSCHSQIWTNSPLLEPIRESYRTGQPLRAADGSVGWNRVNKVPDFVYFNHSIHIERGINCNVCHGPVQKMQLTYKGQPFHMDWCLECHRNPENYVRPRSDVFELYRKAQTVVESKLTAEDRAILSGKPYKRTAAELQNGRNLLQQYGVKVKQLADCWICHR